MQYNKKQVLIDLTEYEAMQKRIKYLERFEPKKPTKNDILLKDIDSVYDLNEFENLSYSFFILFKANLNELGIINTATLDKAKLSSWSNDVRLTIESDKRTLEEFREVYKFLQTNQFWKKNIQSISKLRKQFEKLLFQSRQSDRVEGVKKAGVSEDWLTQLKNDAQQLNN